MLALTLAFSQYLILTVLRVKAKDSIQFHEVISKVCFKALNANIHFTSSRLQ